MKSKILIILAAALIASALFIIAGCSRLKKVEFEITDFDIEENETTYSTSYSGEGTIETDAKGTFSVLLHVTRKDGSSDDWEDDVFREAIVTDGEGYFSTYDYVMNDEKEGYVIPEYDFEIFAYYEYVPVD